MMRVMTPIEEASWKFLKTASEKQTIEELDDAFAEALSALGFDRFSCVRVREPGEPVRPLTIFGCGFDAWDEYYRDSRFLRIDPCIRAFVNRPGAYSWSEIRKRHPDREAEPMWREAKAGGMVDAYIVPVMGPRHETLAVRMATPAPELDPALRPLLQTMAIIYATAGVQLTESVETDTGIALLTRREMECLYWVLLGKSDWEIGFVMSLSPNTVHRHIESAKRKLGVPKRWQAALKASAMGLLPTSQ